MGGGNGDVMIVDLPPPLACSSAPAGDRDIDIDDILGQPVLTVQPWLSLSKLACSSFIAVTHRVIVPQALVG
jgi:hypothetical protein